MVSGHGGDGLRVGLDDLTVKAGNGSYVKLAGEYYGYGAVESALNSENCIEYGYPKKNQDGTYSVESIRTANTYEKKTAAALSSAITINGKSTTLDMSGLERLLLAGKNYIASKALSTSRASGNSTDVLTGESVTVKGTQLAYLVPDSLLGTAQKDYHNPMDYNTYVKAAEIDTIEDNAATVQTKIKKFAKNIARTDKVVKELGNRTLKETGVDAEEPIQTETQKGSENAAK